MKRDNKQEYNVHVGIHNRFDIEVFDSVSGKIRQKAQAFNVILDQFWSGATGNGYIWYGTGTGTPAATDTGLFGTTYKVEATQDATGTDWDNGVCYTRTKIILSETTSVGVTISEVGVGSNSKLGTHALLQDMNGNPISITKTNSDIVTIYATVYAHWNTDGYNNGKVWMTDAVASALSTLSMPNLSGRFSYYDGEGEYVTVNNGGHSYNSQTRTMTGVASRLPVTSGNDLKGLKFASQSNIIYLLESEYPIVGETIGTGDGVTTDFALKFDLPTDATVYLDGIKSSGVTVFNRPMYSPNCYFIEISGYSRADHIIKIGAGTNEQNGTNPRYYLNPYDYIGVSAINTGHVYSWPLTVDVSNDLVSWSTFSHNTRVDIPAEFQHSKFFRFSGYSSGNYLIRGVWADTEYIRDGKMLHFDTPPAAGTVITADYTTPYVPKDANHVFDFSCTLSFGNYEGDT